MHWKPHRGSELRKYALCQNHTIPVYQAACLVVPSLTPLSFRHLRDRRAKARPPGRPPPPTRLRPSLRAPPPPSASPTRTSRPAPPRPPPSPPPACSEPPSLAPGRLHRPRHTALSPPADLASPPSCYVLAHALVGKRQGTSTRSRGHRLGHGQRRASGPGDGQWPGIRRPGTVWPANPALFLT